MTAFAEEATASVMRLEKCEGDVTVKNASGKTLKITDKMRLYNNYEISTDRQSYAYISLDGEKAVKLDASTRVSISKAGKKLEILVSTGKLLFDVSAPLENDESMEIRTSTMMTGVRGTIGYVEIVDVTESTLILLEGRTQVTTVDPVTNETTVTTVTSSQTLSSRITDDDGEETLTVTVTGLEEDAIPGFVRTYVADNPDAQDRIDENTDLDSQAIISGASEILARDEAQAEQQAEDIQDDLSQLETDDVDPLFEKKEDSQPSDEGPSGPATPTEYSVIFNTQGIGTAPSPQTLPSGALVTEPAAPTADGYTFGGWFKDQECTIPWDFSTDTVTATITLYAKWTAATVYYTVTFDVGGIGTAPTDQSIAGGGTVTEPTAPTASGYVFGGWYKDAAFTTLWDFAADTVTADTTLYAMWTINTYVVTFDVGGIGNAPADQNITHGGTVTEPTAPTATGYTFGGWYKDAAFTTLWDFAADTVTANTTLYAKWTAQTISLNNPTTADLIAALQQAASSADITTVRVENAALQLDQAVTVPAGETLEIVSGIVTNDSLTVSGTMTMAAGTTLDNAGDINILSANSLHVGGMLNNFGTITIGGTDSITGEAIPGLLDIPGKLQNSGTVKVMPDTGSKIVNSGTFVNDGSFTVTSAGIFENSGSYEENRTELCAIVSTGTVVSYIGPIADLTAWPDGSTVQLIGGQSGSLPISNPYDTTATFLVEGTVTLDLNGRTLDTTTTPLQIGITYYDQTVQDQIQVAGFLTVKDSSSAGTGKITGSASCTIECLGSLTLESGTIENTGETTHAAAIYVHDYHGSTVRIAGGSVISDIHAISTQGLPSVVDILIEGGYLYGGEYAICNNGSGGLLYISGGTLESPNSVIYSHSKYNEELGSGTLISGTAILRLTAQTYGDTIPLLIDGSGVTLESGTLMATDTVFFDAMQLELPQESFAGGYYSVDLSQNPYIWALENPTEAQLQRALGKSYVQSIQLTNAALTLTGQHIVPSGMALYLSSGTVTIDAAAFLEIAGSFHVQSPLVNHGTLKVTYWTDENNVTTTGTLQLSSTLTNTGVITISDENHFLDGYICNSGGQLINSGIFLNYAYLSHQKGSYVTVDAMTEDGISELVYIGAADGTAWKLDNASNCTVQFFVLDSTTMYIPDTFSNISLDMINASSPLMSANIATQSGTLTLQNNSYLFFTTVKADMPDYSVPYFNYTGSIIVSDSSLSVENSTFTSTAGATSLITVSGTDYSNLDLSGACTLTHNGTGAALSIQNASLNVYEFVDELTGNIYTTNITSNGSGITVNGVASVMLSYLTLTATGNGLELRGSGGDGGYLNICSITAGGTAIIAETPINLSNCTITSTGGTAIENYGMIDIADCIVTGATAALYNSGTAQGYSDLNQFILSDANATANTFVVYNESTGDVSQLYGTFKARSAAQLFYGVSVPALPTAPDADGWYVCTLTVPS